MRRDHAARLTSSPQRTAGRDPCTRGCIAVSSLIASAIFAPRSAQLFARSWACFSARWLMQSLAPTGNR